MTNKTYILKRGFTNHGKTFKRKHEDSMTFWEGCLLFLVMVSPYVAWFVLPS